MRQARMESASSPLTARRFMAAANGRVARAIARMFAAATMAVAPTAAWSQPVAAAPPAQQTVDVVQQARSLAEQKRFAEAQELLGRALAAKPDDAGVLSARGDLYRRMDRMEDARIDYQRIVDLRPGDEDAWFWLATIDRWRGRHSEAVREYGRVIEISPCSTGALTGRARVFRSDENLAGAEADLRTALRCKPADHEATELLAELQWHRGDSNAAESTLRATFKDAELEHRLGDLAISADQPGHAAQHFTRALEQRPDDASSMRGLGDAERRSGRDGRALAAYRRAATAEPANTDALYWVGVLAGRLGKIGEAFQAFDEILDKKPNDTGAMIAKARLYRSLGHDDEALALVDRSLAVRPDNGEALVLRGALLSGMGRDFQARASFRSALAKSPDDGDAHLLLQRVRPSRSIDLAGRYDDSEVIEGLEDAGLIVEGHRITPTWIEYLTEGGGADVLADLSEKTALGAGLERRREAVINMGADRAVYDFNVTIGQAGLEHRLSELWGFSWRVGGARYESRESGTIPTDNRFQGYGRLERSDGHSRFSLTVSRAPFIIRGYAGDYQFRIFDQDRLSLGWERALGGGFSLRTAAGVSFFNDGDTPVSGSVALGWDRGDWSATLRAGHDPFPARFLGPSQRLEYIGFTSVRAAARTPQWMGFRFAAEALTGRFSATERTIELNGELTPGPLEQNNQYEGRATLTWSPPVFRELGFGVEYFSDHYDFDTGPYNNLNARIWTYFATLAGQSHGKFRYALRYANDRITDERQANYSANAYSARLEIRLGYSQTAGGAYWLGLEGEYGDNDLREKRTRYRLYLNLPF